MLSGKASEVFEELRKKILSGVYVARFPSDREIMGRYGISKTTLRAVVDELKARHIVERRSRSGTRLVERAQSLASSIFGVIFHDTRDLLISAMVGGISNAAFLAAAARANDDPATAERLEKAVDRQLVRTNGLYYLDLNREWRIGVTAHRIMALAIAHGASFRRLAER